MTLDAYTHQIEQLKTYIENRTKHLYIEKYIDQPEIDVVKLALLMNIYKHSSLTKDRQRKYLVSTMLVQMAADIHELVPVTNEHKTYDSEKEKQLLVLAGDYYSGLHYLDLAHTGDFKMLQTIARTVREINELKMGLYYNRDVSFGEIVNYQKQIHSLITVRILELFTNFSVQSFVTDFIIAYKLIVDKESITQSNKTHLFTKIFNKYSKKSLIFEIDKAIHQHIERLEKHLSDSSTAASLQALKFDQLFNEYIVKQSSFVEEG